MRSREDVEKLLTIMTYFGDKQAVKALTWVLSHEPPDEKEDIIDADTTV